MECSHKHFEIGTSISANQRLEAPSFRAGRSHRLLELLGIKPGEAEAIKAVSKQLEEFELYGLVKTDGKDWQWIA